jgi:hypothetical protein
MIIIEGPRRCGKSFTKDVLLKKFGNLILFKDLGMRIIKDTPIDPDDFAIGRDLAYAQFVPQFSWAPTFDRLVMDRGYWSSYVYGQCWRNRYNKNFWSEHLKRVEDFYGSYLEKVKILVFHLNEDDFKRMESMDREKDVWEHTNDYRQQYELYSECAEKSQAKIFLIDAFQSEDYIARTFSEMFNS